MNKLDLSRKWGILDPEGEGYNPLTGREYKNYYKHSDNITYKSLAFNVWSKLPISKHAKDIIKKSTSGLDS